VSLLLSQREFADARRALRSGEVTAELYVWLGRLIAVTQATRALAPSPLPSGRWDDREAVAETLHAWLEESLLRGGLLRAFDRCRTPRALSRYLERALRNWLVARSRRSSGPRLLERAGLLMAAEDGFALVRDANVSGERWWGLAEWRRPALYAGSDETLVASAWALGDFALLRYPSSQRSDPVLSTSDLRRFLRGLLERVGAALSGRHLDTALRGRFAYAYAPTTVGLDEVEELAAPETTAGPVEIEDAARAALGSLSCRQLRVLRERPQDTLERLAGRLGVSRGTVDNEYRRAVMAVLEASPSDEDFAAVLEEVLRVASQGGNGDE
jgi:hypothetical protein